MRLYVEVARRTFARVATYRSATVAGVFTNTVFGFLSAYVLLAVYRERDSVGGFDSKDAITFTFVTQGLLAVLGLFGEVDLAQRITNGDIAVDFQRPYDQQAWWLAARFGKAAYYSVFRGIPPFVAGAVVFDLRLPAAADVVPFLATVLVAITVAFGWSYLLQLSAFWLLDVRGPVQLGWLVAHFLSGMYIPIVFFPGWLESTARLLPFASMVQVPIEVWLGKHRGADLAMALAGQVAWAIVLAVAGRWMMSRAERRVVVQGG
jgi:ABC-2 type transport system permease protein